MDIDKAYTLVNSLREVTEHEKIKTKSHFQNYAKLHFVSSIFSKKIIRKNTWQGFITSCLPRKQFEKQKAYIITKFAKAIFTIDREVPEFEHDDFFRKLKTEFRRAHLLEQFENVNSSSASKDIEDLFKLTPSNKVIEASVFKELLTQDISDSQSNLKHFMWFLDNNSKYKSDEYAQRFGSLCNALQNDQEGYHRDRSKELAEQVMGLKQGDSFYFWGSYGTPLTSIDKVMNALENIRGTTINVPEPVKKKLKKPLPDPKKLVLAIVEGVLKKMSESIPGLNYAPSAKAQKALNAFLMDPSKKLPNELREMLPEAVFKELELMYQNGILGNLIDFLDKSPLRKLMELSCLQSGLIKDATERKRQVDIFCDQFIQSMCELIGDPKGSAEDTFKQLMASFEKIFNPLVYLQLGISPFIHSKYWVEVIRRENLNCDVIIHGFNPLSSTHEKESVIYRDVAFQSFSTKFFDGLLQHRYDKKLKSTAIKLSTSFAFNEYQHTEKQTKSLEAAFIKPDCEPELVIFEMQLQAMLAYARPCVDDHGNLVIKNSEMEHNLALAHKKLSDEYKKVVKLLDFDSSSQIQATLNTLDNALIKKAEDTARKNEETIPGALAIPIQKLAFEMEITSESLLSMRDSMSWLFGKQVEPLFNFLIDVLNLPDENAVPEFLAQNPIYQISQAKKMKWTQKSMFIKVTSIALSVAYTVLEGIVFMLGLYRSGLSFVALLTGFDWIMANVVPKVYRKLYKNTMKGLRHAFFNKIISFIASIFLSAQRREEFQNKINFYLNLAERYGNTLSDKQKVAYKVKTYPAKHAAHVLDLKSMLASTPNQVNKKAEEMKLHHDNIPQQIENWMSQINNEPVLSKRMGDLLQCVSALPIPSKEDSSFWNTVQLEDSLDSIVKLNAQLKESYKAQEEMRPQLNMEYVLASFHLLTVMQCLVQRSLPDFPKEPLDISPFILWYQAQPKKFSNSEDINKFKALCAYFNIEIDMTRMASSKLLSLRNSRLFSINTSMDLGYLLNHYKNTIEKAAKKAGDGISYLQKINETFRLPLIASKFEEIINLINPDIFSSPELLFNLNHSGTLQTSPLESQYLQSTHSIELPREYLILKNEFLKMHGELPALLLGNEQDLEVNATETWGNSTYRQVSLSNKKLMDFVIQTNLKVPEIVETCWIEESEEAIRHIVFRNGSQETHVTLERDAKDHQKYRPVSYLINDHEKISVDLSKDLHTVHSLSKFCNFASINCWKSKESDFIEEIELPYDLKFKVQEIKGKKQAIEQTKYADYHIASNQAHPSLRGISSYLLLKANDPNNSKMKVLLPSNQWLSSAFWKGIRHLGPLANFHLETINTFNNSIVNDIAEVLGLPIESTYYEVELDKNGTFQSSDPIAMAYLATLFLLQDNPEKAGQIIRNLERQIAACDIPQGFENMAGLLYLAASQYPTLKEERMRLFAKLETNEKYLESITHTRKSWQAKTLSAFISFKILADLESMQSNNDILPQHERDLYKMALRNLKFLSHNTSVESDEGILNPKLAARFKELLAT